MSLLRLFAILLLSLLAAPAAAKDDFQQWLTASVRIDPSERIAIQNETIARFSDDRQGLYELENAIMLGYKLGKTVSVWAGYVHNPQYDAGDFTLMERRARGQLTIENLAKLGNISLSGRVRLEQRWREGIDSAGSRVRPYIKLSVPLGGKTAPTLSLSTEPFINLNTTSFQSSGGLDRTRSAIALTFPLGKAARLEAGYLNQHRFIRGGPDGDDRVMTATLSLAF